jgi:hypothetical protein
LSNSTFPPRKEAVWPRTVWRLIEFTSCQRQTQRTLLDWLRVEYEIAKPGNKLLALAELDSDNQGWSGCEIAGASGAGLRLTWA